MKNIADIIYSPLLEEEDHKGWDKATVDYYTKHLDSLARYCYNCRKTNITKEDIEEILQNLAQTLYESDDYDINKAIENSNSGNIVELSGYVHSLAKGVTEKYCSEKKNRREESDISINKEGEEVSIYDTTPSESSKRSCDSVLFDDLDNLCRVLESDRYSLGTDIFQIWYIRLLTSSCNKDDKYKDILSIIGITRNDIKVLEEDANFGNIMQAFSESISKEGVDRAIEILENYTYATEKIKKVVGMS